MTRWFLWAGLVACGPTDPPDAPLEVPEDTDSAPTDAPASTDTDTPSTGEEDRWWCDLELVDTAVPPEDTGSSGNGDAVVSWSGKTSAATGLGDITYYWENPTDGTTCVLDFKTASASEMTTCPDCDLAWAKVLDSPTIATDGGGCATGLTLQGATLYVGESDGELVFSEDGATWEPAPASDSRILFGYWSFSFTEP